MTRLLLALALSGLVGCGSEYKPPAHCSDNPFDADRTDGEECMWVYELWTTGQPPGIHDLLNVDNLPPTYNQ